LEELPEPVPFLPLEDDDYELELTAPVELLLLVVLLTLIYVHDIGHQQVLGHSKNEGIDMHVGFEIGPPYKKIEAISNP
jgi:hypothetical protein